MPDLHLSVVIPVFNEAPHLPATVDALVTALDGSGFDAEVIVVDDGSSDRSAEVARAAIAGRLPLDTVSQENAGRFEARRAGLEAARGEWVLLLDGRVRLRRDALRFVRERLSLGETIWNGHVHIETHGNPYASFWKVLVELAWREYFDDPRTTSFDLSRFDHYPKGTSCFLAPKEVLLRATEEFRASYGTLRLVSDDTHLIRGIAREHAIHLSPAFACDYESRSTLGAFMRNGLYRGTTFVDGHGRCESRFFPVVVAFYPASIVLAAASIRRPWLPLACAAAASGIAAAVSGGPTRSRFERASFAGLMPVYSVAHGAGMWRGLALRATGLLGR